MIDAPRPVPAVPAGGVLRVVAPCGVVRPDAVADGLRHLRDAGFCVQLADHVYGCDSSAPYLAGTDRERAADLTAAFLDDDVHGVICARGGFGAMRTLELLGCDAWPAKPLLGFSDVTALHGWLLAQQGMMSLHGPLLSTLAAHEPEALAGAVGALRGLAPAPLAMQTVCPGVADGPLVGGNLSLLSSLAGTRWFPSLRGAVVFIEEIGEAAYRIDRMITSLMWRGLREAAAVVFGDLGSTGDRYVAGADLDASIRDRVCQLMAPLGIPVAWGAGFGHRTHNATLHVGARASLRADANGAVLRMACAVEAR